ncbi:Abortive infection protein [Oceanithermus profundus DSM 14977]|uniref:Abortive infection protein n=1 Tax=Oceanithermus profundus (strain DSM 14977 / NBRC 100410 / VKM B-2274 / 506) TaxID=670487 RepID=E4U6Z1_OCEP5|nr:CPBP family intramembrane glutamic endopeptidase [Oceanithermus profundus]ADR35994.1 Abortive infection protein [Oceanithermus profundus DSM 14977]
MSRRAAGFTAIREVLPWLLAPPFFFLLALAGASVLAGLSGARDPEAVTAAVEGSLPQVLLVVQLGMLGLVLLVLRRGGWRALGWKPLRPGRATVEIAVGVAAGAALGLLYPVGLEPLHLFLQRTFGDYVPPGGVQAAFGPGAAVFFAANVLLAPFAEESLYRGFALERLQMRLAPGTAVGLSAVFFGLLHWAGGFWYMVLTGGVLGTLFGAFFLWRGSVLAPFFAHLTLNLLEFAYLAL